MKLIVTQFTPLRFAFFTLLLLSFQLFSASAQTVIVPFGNPSDSSSEQPFGCFFGYERTEALYLSSDLVAGSTITEVGFYVNTLTNPSLSTPVVIKMKTTGAATISADTYINASAGATTVWSGNITSGMLSEDSWVTLTLSAPFTYSANNLAVFVETNFGNFGDESDTAKQFRQANTGGNLCQVWYDDIAPPTDLGIPLVYRPNIQLTFVASCSGAPDPGNTLTTSDTVCNGSLFTLSIQNPLGGETYQWQRNGINLLGATNATYTGTTNATATYHCIVTCTSSAQTANSTDLVITLQSFYHCYCASYAITTEDTKIDSVQLGTISTGTDTFQCESYTDYTSNTTTLNPGQPNLIHIVNGSCTGEAYEAYVAVFIDYNHNTSFDSTEIAYSYGPIDVLNGIPDGTFFVPATATSGITGMRIILQEGQTVPESCGTYTRGETEDYLVNITAVSPCSGTPSPDSTLSTLNSVCPGQHFTLYLKDYPSASNITYQWQSSPTGAIWTNISGETYYTYDSSQTTSTYYRCKITCTSIGGGFTYSYSIHVTMRPSYECYCTSGSISVTNDTKIDTVQFGSINAGSAPDHCESYTDNTAYVTDLAVDVPIPLHIVNGSCDGQFYESYLAVYIDYNKNGSYADAGETVFSYGPTTGLNSIPDTSVTVPLNASSGFTGMRVILKEDSVPNPCALYLAGETEDYVVNIGVASACEDPVTPGIAIASPDTICSAVLPSNVSLSLSGNSSGLGQTYQWQDSTSGGNWANIPGATSSSASPLIDAGSTVVYYRAIETCGLSTLPSAEAMVVVKPSPVAGNTIDVPIVVNGFPYTDNNNNFSANCWTDDYTGVTNQASPDVFYKVMTGSVAGELLVSTCNTTDLNTYIHILASNENQLYFNDFDGDLCTPSIYASDSFHVSATDQYFYVVVEGAGSLQGNYRLDLNFWTAVNVNPLVNSGAEISLFPNPNSGAFDLSFDLKQNINDVATVSITNVIGQVLDEMKVPVVNGKLSKEISMPNRTEDGLYFVNIRINDLSLNQRFIIQH